MNTVPTAFVILLALPGLVFAAGNDPGRIESIAPGGGMLVQLTLGLAVVLAIAVGLSWLLRRYALPRVGGMIRVLGGLPLGTRERLLLVEVDDVRLLLGITSSQIQALHVFTSAASQSATPASFRVAPVSPSSEAPHDTQKS